MKKQKINNDTPLNTAMSSQHAPAISPFLITAVFSTVKTNTMPTPVK